MESLGQIDIGSTAFMLFSTALVMIMTPGLALFYGGLVGRKNVLAIMIQSFFSMAWTTFLWWAIGYSLVFSGGAGKVIGNLDQIFLIGIHPADLLGNGNNIPVFCFIAYQMMFAIITPALITGAFANRIRFNAYIIFLTLWLVFVYFPIAHNVWGGGLFSTWGVLDFAGGTAVHTSSGFAALASVYYVGKRKVQDKGPHSIPLVAIGTALLWFGWYGFNAGSELKIDAVTSVAFINTDVAASVAAVTWLLIEWFSQRKPKFVGLLTGAVAGLVAITPAAGYVNVTGSVFIGIIASFVCYLAVSWKNKRGLDDALDVWGVHGVGGFFGCILTGVFATKIWNPSGADGLLLGNVNFFMVETLSAVITAVYSFLFTLGTLWLINKVVKVKVSAEEEEIGLDMALHGEEAYLS
ncbi:MAG: ammonium transporter [Ignavibacteria bacterium]|nr:ammonium transporter [Ignavibacteria bacterium]